MSDIRVSLPALFATHSAAALMVVLLLLSFYRHSSSNYLRLWIQSWVSVAVFYALMVVDARFVSSSGSIVTLERLLATAGAGVAMLLQVVWLGTGIREFATTRPVRRRTVHALALMAVLLGAAQAMMFRVFLPSLLAQDFVQVAVRVLVIAALCIVSGFFVWKKRCTESAVGLRLFAISLVVYGGVQLFCFLLAMSHFITGDFIFRAAQIGVIDLSALSIVAIGVIVAVLEDERERVVIAAAQIEHLAYFDSLTGLPNRSLFFDRLMMVLAQAARQNTKAAVFFFDLDRFKYVNDSLGHSTGDALLRAAGRRIREILRQSDTLARFGGDEFMVLIQSYTAPAEVECVAQKILEVMKLPFSLGGREIVISASIGIATYPADGSDAETLVKHSDSAMYRAKEAGRDRYHFFTADVSESNAALFELESRCWKARELNELSLVYQPILDIRNNRISACEALLRWNHPDLGLLVPAQFIPVAEASGSIVVIGDWVLQSACAQARAWHELGYRDLSISVNISGKELFHSDLVGKVQRVLENTPLDPRFLELELNETTAVADREIATTIMTALRQIGVRITIDNFGGGNSALRYLKRFAVDTLKIDRSFVQGINEPENAAIITALTAMGQSLGMKVIAEGVETDEQLDFLRSRKCDAIQGYVISAPLPGAEFEKYLSLSPAVTRWVGAIPIKPATPQPSHDSPIVS